MTLAIYIELKMTAFWDTAPCSLVKEDRRFRGTYSLHRHRTSVSNESNQRYIPESSHLHSRRHENLKSHISWLVFIAWRCVSVQCVSIVCLDSTAGPVEPMARVPNVAREKMFLASSFNSCRNSFPD
jgi:hypothetical protein